MVAGIWEDSESWKGAWLFPDPPPKPWAQQGYPECLGPGRGQGRVCTPQLLLLRLKIKQNCGSCRVSDVCNASSVTNEVTTPFSDFVPENKAEEMKRVALILVGFHCGTADSKVPHISLTYSHRHVLLAHGRVNKVNITAVCDLGNHTALLWQRQGNRTALEGSSGAQLDVAFTSPAPTPKAVLRPSPTAADIERILSLGRQEERSGTAAGSNAIRTASGARGRLSLREPRAILTPAGPVGGCGSRKPR